MYNFWRVSKDATTIVPATGGDSFVGSNPPSHLGIVVMSNVNPYQTAQSQPTAQASYSTRMMQIKKIEPLSAGKLLGTMYALLGLLIGGIFTLLALVGVAAGGGGGDAALGSIIGGIGAIIIMPLFYGVLGFIGGTIGAFFYNIIASMVGGISLEIEV